VAKSVKKYGDKIPLLWAFFSCPESHINHEFSLYSRSHIFTKVELLMSESGDGNIRLYFCDKLLPLASADTMWPLEDTLDILVSMVTELWIYAATLVRFIIDQHAVSPQWQLEDVLAFHAQQIQSSTKSNITSKLDVFYKMIIDCISPEHHLPIV